MRKNIDKLLIIVCCFVFCGRSAIEITAALTAVTLSAVCQYTEKSKISFSAELLYILLCFASPVFLCALPVIIYDIYDDKRRILLALGGAAYISAVLTHSLNSPSVSPVICAVAVLLCHRTASYEKLYESYIKTVDNSNEINRLLKENNIKLIENKNYEIRLATLNERNRIAREIHDNVGHLLSRSILQVQALKLIGDDALRNESLNGLGETLGSAMSSIRQSVHDLHDDSIDLKASIKESILPLNSKGIAVNCECRCSENVPNKIKICVICIVKEAVSNIIKHSCADRVSVIFHEHPAFYQLKIEDNGKCSEMINENGIGLSNMRARIEELGGIINISSGKKGFRIFISIRKG